jgi:DNA-binding MurR/RpiR family transcriptional regulator
MAGSVETSRTLDRELAVRRAQARARLSPNDHKLYTHIRDHTDQLAFHTAQSLADTVGVSRAAVVRFSWKLGYKGFTELRDAARGEMQERETARSPLSRFADDGHPPLTQKFHLDALNLEATQELTADQIVECGRHLARAKTIFIVAGRKTYGLALYFHRILRGVRSQVILVDPSYPDELAQIQADDTIVVLSFWRYSLNTIAALGYAKQKGASTVVITDGDEHPFTANVTFVLRAATESTMLYGSMVAPVAVIEALTGEVAAADHRRSRKNLKDMEDLAEELNFYLFPH